MYTPSPVPVREKGVWANAGEGQRGGEGVIRVCLECERAVSNAERLQVFQKNFVKNVSIIICNNQS